MIREPEQSDEPEEEMKGMTRAQAAAYARARAHRLHIPYVIFSTLHGYAVCAKEQADRLHLPYEEVVTWIPLPMRHSHAALARWS